jgi:hypothetical protein
MSRRERAEITPHEFVLAVKKKSGHGATYCLSVAEMISILNCGQIAFTLWVCSRSATTISFRMVSRPRVTLQSG